MSPNFSSKGGEMPDRQNTTTTTLERNAVGSIDPRARVEKREITEDAIDHFASELHGDRFYTKIDSFMPKCCVDGRHRLDGSCEYGANAAGGAFSLLVADMLTTQRFRRGADGEEAANTLQYAANLFDHLNSAGYQGQYGDHRADHHGEDQAGCGAVDKMFQAVAFIAARGDQLREMLESLGVVVDDEMHSDIIKAADEQVKEQGLKFASGDQMLSALEEVAGDESVEILTGPHNEVAVVINERLGTTLDRAAIQNEYGDDLEAFNYDRWAMREAVKVISQDVTTQEAERKLLAADYFNLAVTCILAGPSLRVVTRMQHEPVPAAA